MAAGLDPKALRKLGNATLQVLEKHLSPVSNTSASVLPTVKPGELASQFGSMPEKPQEYNSILKDLEKKILPGVVQWQHPNFMAYFPANTTVPAAMGDLVITSIGTLGLQWASCPIATELEVVVMDWIAKLFGIGGPFLHTSKQGGGMIQSTASDCAVAVASAARVKKLTQLLQQSGRSPSEIADLRFNSDASKLVTYQSTCTHFSGEKAARVAGIRCHKIKSKLLKKTGNYGITVADVEKQIKEDLAAGLTPCMVQLNYGTTNTCGYDDLAGFDRLRKKYGLWIHVDAAYAGSTWALPEFHPRSKQVAAVADSINVNASKWMLCGFDTSLLYVRDKRPLLDIFSATDNYMADDVDVDCGAVYSPEFKDWGVPLGRKFRSLRVWMVLSYYGKSGIQKSIRNGISCADFLREKVESDPNFVSVARTDTSLVCFRVVSSSGRNISREICDYCTTQGYFFNPSVLNGDVFIRVAFGGVNTTVSHAKKLWKVLQKGQKHLSKEEKIAAA
eukprot:TRINITY_DN10899_c0_g3_i1.p1 TRINITY_DN10899_c0_g3~~TRINITY_DN10899_c0_g3_i1.p1  ORF type:complete len:505 (+),score=79.24 TRINITY_DN10899_c0_g3_i1:572-2086(+)